MYYYGFKFLLLPEPSLGIAKKNWSKYKKDDLEVIFSLSNGSNINFEKIKDYFHDLYQGTTPLSKNNDLYTQYVDWSTDDAEYFLNQINTWWIDKKENIKKIYNLKNSFFNDHLKQAMVLIISCLCRVILPRLKDSNAETKEIAKTLISELEEVDISVLSILPMILFLEADNPIERISRKIRSGLSSLTSEEIDNAILGIKHWLICSQQNQIPEPPSDLLNELINKIVHRRKPCLNFAIFQLTNIIRTFPDILTTNQLQSLLLGLEYLLEETKLPNNWREWKIFNQDINSIIEVEERPDYMRLTAYLALQLYEIYKKRDTELPQILIDWKEAALNSVFPEVRKVWEGYS